MTGDQVHTSIPVQKWIWKYSQRQYEASAVRVRHIKQVSSKVTSLFSTEFPLCVTIPLLQLRKHILCKERIFCCVKTVALEDTHLLWKSDWGLLLAFQWIFIPSGNDLIVVVINSWCLRGDMRLDRFTICSVLRLGNISILYRCCDMRLDIVLDFHRHIVIWQVSSFLGFEGCCSTCVISTLLMIIYPKSHCVNILWKHQ